MAHLRRRSHWTLRPTSRKPSGQDGDVIRLTAHLGRVHSPSTWSPELLEPGKGTKPRPNRLCLCGLPENLNLSSLDLGSAHNPGPALDSSCRATWSLSSVDQESTLAVSGDKPSVAQTLRTLPTHASDVRLQCSSLLPLYCGG